MKRFAAVLALAALLAAPSSVFAQSARGCAPGQAPLYVFGFADLSARLGAAMGSPVTCEYPDPKGTGDIEQNTSRGLAFWRGRTNTPTFTDGYNHWALSRSGKLTWKGSSIDPPGSEDASVPPLKYGGEAPVGCEVQAGEAWNPLGGPPIYFCDYVSTRTLGMWHRESSGWVFLGSASDQGVSLTDAGRVALNRPSSTPLVVSAPLPATAEPGPSPAAGSTLIGSVAGILGVPQLKSMTAIFDRDGSVVAWLNGDVIFDLDGQPRAFVSAGRVYSYQPSYLGQLDRAMFRDADGAVVAFLDGAQRVSDGPLLPLQQIAPFPPIPGIPPIRPIPSIPPISPIPLLSWSSHTWGAFLAGR